MPSDQDRRPEQRPQGSAGGQIGAGPPHVHGRAIRRLGTPRERAEGHVVLAHFCADGCARDAHEHGTRSRPNVTTTREGIVSAFRPGNHPSMSPKT